MIVVATSTLLVGVLAPLFRARLWGAPLTLFSGAMALRALLGASLITFLACAILLMPFPPELAGAYGGAIGMVLMVLSARRLRHPRGVMLLAWRLGDPDSRPIARAALDKKLKRLAKSGNASELAVTTLLAAAPLSAVGEWELLQSTLASIDRSALPDALRSRVLQALATCRLDQGDLEGATAALEEIPDPPPEAIKHWLGLTKALIVVVQGGVDEARALLEEQPAGEDAALGAAHGVVRAHAHACCGDDDAARSELEAALGHAGVSALHRALRPVGPATDLAREMLASREG